MTISLRRLLIGGHPFPRLSLGDISKDLFSGDDIAFFNLIEGFKNIRRRAWLSCFVGQRCNGSGELSVLLSQYIFALFRGSNIRGVLLDKHFDNRSDIHPRPSLDRGLLGIEMSLPGHESKTSKNYGDGNKEAVLQQDRDEVPAPLGRNWLENARFDEQVMPAEK